LTYPHSGIISKESLLETLKKFNLESYIIAQEKHEDGDNHLHAYIKTAKKLTWKVDLFDHEYLHGNY